MASVAEGGASLAWRLLATLEGGTLLLALGSALIALSARRRAKRSRARRRPVNSVLISNTECVLGKTLKIQLESRGCTVSPVTEESIKLVSSGAASKVDALVVIGAEPKTNCLNGMAEFVSEDVHNNLKLLESLSTLVKPGGYIAWACAGNEAGDGAFSVVGSAFDAVIQASLKYIAKSSRCEGIWIDRNGGAIRTAERLTAALMPCASSDNSPRFSFQNTLFRIAEYIGRWLKIVT